MFQEGRHVPVSYAARQARTLGEMLRVRASASRHAAAMFEKGARGAWERVTWGTFWDRARSVAAGLVALGVGRGHRVAVLGATRAAWGVYDLGGQLAGAVTLGVYPKQSTEQVAYLLGHSEARVLFVEDDGELDTALAAAESVSSEVLVVPWSEAALERARARHPTSERLRSPRAFEGAPLPEADVARLLDAQAPDDAAILVYTSGTTGPPKGAMITHANILAVLGADAEFLDFYEDDLSLSFLPMAHVAERVLAFYGRISSGVPTAYATSTATVLAELQEVRPTVFGSVPRIFEKAYAKIHGELEKKPPAVRRLFAWAIDVGARRAALEHAGRPVPLGLRAQTALADRLVYRKVRAAFGGRVRMFVTGAAPIARSILELFWACGLPVYEAYGMTEATVITHINTRAHTRLGSVGRIIPPMEAVIAEDGEVLLRGPFVFKGYDKQPEATAETVIDGWLHTGDIGRIDDDGYLFITDRKKHLIITAGGKNLSLANIERALREADPLIGAVHAHGDGRRFVSALLTPSALETLEWGAERGLVTREEITARTEELLANPAGRTPALEAATARVTAHPEFQERMREAVARGNRALAQVERVKRFVVLGREFSQERGELTPTMKVKRKAIERAFAAELDRLYTEADAGLTPKE
ncbi:MAG TPA: long-chain fatty acid--CoA ligase [Polyangiaceae bacterium]|nr:long-chain fatty acid--CoA ligase [Polyangiaceae bacterium]